MNKRVLVTGAIMALVAVILGAFASHGLKATLSETALNTFETGVRYQMYHALMLMVVGCIPQLTPKQRQTILYLVIAGVVCFSCSIYVLATKSIHGIDLAAVGIITPIGGLLLIGAWAFLIIQILRYKKH